MAMSAVMSIVYLCWPLQEQSTCHLYDTSLHFQQQQQKNNIIS